MYRIVQPTASPATAMPPPASLPPTRRRGSWSLQPAPGRRTGAIPSTISATAAPLLTETLQGRRRGLISTSLCLKLVPINAREARRSQICTRHAPSAIAKRALTLAGRPIRRVENGGKNGMVAKGGKAPPSTHERDDGVRADRSNGDAQASGNGSAGAGKEGSQPIPSDASASKPAASPEVADSSPRVSDRSDGSPAAEDEESIVAGKAAPSPADEQGAAASSSADSHRPEPAGAASSGSAPAADSAPKPTWAAILKSREPAPAPVRVARPAAAAASTAGRVGAAARGAGGDASASSARSLELDAWKRAQEEAKMQAELEARRARGDEDRKARQP